MEHLYFPVQNEVVVKMNKLNFENPEGKNSSLETKEGQVKNTRENEPLRIIETKRKNLEKQLIELLIPPSNPFRKTIWKYALSIAKARTESESKNKEGKNDKVKAAAEIALASKIVDELLLSFSREVLFPLLKVMISREHKDRLAEYRLKYAELLELKESEDMERAERREDIDISDMDY
ncbi:MAG: hypothetical protein AB1607_09635 [Chloroflexota bacterium]